jgi:phthalate 4,5-dioxygenase oxygenase subunit
MNEKSAVFLSMSDADDMLLTRVANDAPMGRFLRENYWFPAILSQSLIADGTPMRVTLLGKRYVAFRSTDGRVGFFNEACPHRRVSLLLGRNENNSLRCIFHGWRFGVDGTVLEVPTHPGDQASFCGRVPLTHYPVREAAGLVWVFLGSVVKRFPDFEFMRATGAHVVTAHQKLRYNWVQALDGLADSSHIGAVAAAGRDLAPTYEFMDRPAGFRFAAVRNVDADRRYCRISEFVAPCYTFIAYPRHGYVVASVPSDDETCAQYVIQYNLERPVIVEPSVLDDLANWPPYLRGGENEYWGQNREAMKRAAFSGFSIHEADFAVNESEGTITDRSQEFLHDSDLALIRLRQTLIDAAREFRDGKMPRIAEHLPDAYSSVAVCDKVVAKEQDWRG